ncbi:hypothetical protein J5N97_027128 [Dioscorea zingiberensis]|uniref:Uncharacterized protein n=1 Tax=Dioscorea zingiberensis TaxID=325984 RepID=A0A9D5C3L1_9LILI|nr:hypothetical protein J5N97_027128 [Dioscorea zingiberensis]
MSVNPAPPSSHRNLDEQISQLMQCKPLSEQEVVIPLLVCDDEKTLVVRIMINCLTKGLILHLLEVHLCHILRQIICYFEILIELQQIMDVFVALQEVIPGDCLIGRDARVQESVDTLELQMIPLNIFIKLGA